MRNGEDGAISRDPVWTAIDFKFPATRLEVLATGSFQDVLARRRHGPILSEVWEQIILSSPGLKGTTRGVPSIGVKIRECFWEQGWSTFLELDMSWEPGIWRGSQGLCVENKTEANLPEPHLKTRARGNLMVVPTALGEHSPNHSPEARSHPHFSGLRLDLQMS